MNGAILYEGPSLLDGKPIVVIATGLEAKSRNDKTGAMVQTWIMRSDVAPHEAIKTGADASVCGTCPHRGRIEDGKNVSRACYVVVHQAPLSVWNSYKRGIYPKLAPNELQEAGADKTIRIGSYGDPAAVPYVVWSQFTIDCESATGYTHAWRECDERLQLLCMASCDNITDWMDAKRAGWRTFRVRRSDEPLASREIACPASKEAGYKTNCAACRACGGLEAKAKVDIAIMAHGAVSKINAFNRESVSH